MAKPPSIPTRNTIHWRQILPTFLVLFLPLITCLAVLLFLHTEEVVRLNTLLIAPEQIQGNAFSSSDQRARQGQPADKKVQIRRSHLVLFLGLLTVALPLFWWLALLLTATREHRKHLLTEKQQVAHLSVLLQTIIDLHRLIGQEKEKDKLIQACCELLVASRGYASAWIILLAQDEKIEFSAESGLYHSMDALQKQISLGGLPPCVVECRRKQPEIVAIEASTSFCQHCPMANNYPSSGLMCVALEHNSRVFGFLNVSLAPELIGDQEEQRRFSEIAGDIGYALFNLDEQQKKIEMETALRQSEACLRSITDFAKDAILMMDSQGAISFWNPAAETILGYRAEEVLGKNLHALLVPTRYHQAHHDAFPEFIRTGCGNAMGKTLELAALRKDGREIPVALSLSAVFQDGSWQAVGILRDITDRKRMEEQMLQSEKMTTIAGLAAGVAHEINTPLSAILQSIQVVRQDLSPELPRNQEIAGLCGLDLARVTEYFEKREINYFLDGIRDSAIKSGKIIANLLQFSRPRQLVFGMADLAQLLDKSVELSHTDYDLRKLYASLHVEFIREYAPNLPPVSCVTTEIEQVFINLLKNAVQAMAELPEPRPAPRITLRIRRQDSMLRAEIEDNGIGMDENTRRHIFDPFFTTRDVGAGPGLGLSVSYIIIVTKHGGQLTVQSTPGQGTTVAVDLPLTSTPPDETT
ncbi:MAG: PAS domain S-box protein [Desulfobulbaceae bacterium]|nr:PAS domain S-box protein [Desulfobulbaceae bacterium]